MRIISGTAKGRRLLAPAGDRTRPTSDKIRGSVFNILLSQTRDARVLDLFGGTGAMALEALSRGAAYAVIVDSDRQAAEVIRKNAFLVLGDNASAQMDILKMDYRRALDQMRGQRFDLIFLDPPYRMEEAYGQALSLMTQRELLAQDAVVVCERARAAQITYGSGFAVYDTRVYGETSVDFLREERSE